jgi:N-acetylmuramoyl-L-alanine amidase
MEIVQYYQTKNPCYKAGKKITPSGIVVHSTGANNPNLKRYVGPDDGILGKNTNNNHWNRADADKCMHAFIGKAADGSVMVYQTLPWDHRCWGVGSGKKGSYNATHIQFEICEDGMTNAAYYREAFVAAKQLCAFLCEKYGISVDNVVGHYEAAQAGYGSNHADPRNWQSKFGDSMDQFRRDVKALLGQVDASTTQAPKEAPKQETTYSSYTVQKGDTLWRIAHKKLGSGKRYKEIMTASGLKSDRLQIGQTIKIPKA